LRGRGRDVVAVDLPIEDRSGGWPAYADAVVQATARWVHRATGLHRMPVDLLVLVTAMVPLPGERAIDYWVNACYEDGSHDDVDVFFHDVPPGLAAQTRRAERDQAETPMHEP